MTQFVVIQLSASVFCLLFSLLTGFSRNNLGSTNKPQLLASQPAARRSSSKHANRELDLLQPL